MVTAFLVCAVVGGVVMLCQFALTLAGLGGDHDIHVDHPMDMGDHSGTEHTEHGSTWFFKMLSLRSLVAAVTFFGLGGLAAASSPLFAPFAVVMAASVGVLAMLVVAWLMSLLHSLQSEGTAYIEHALGCSGTVYLSIPANREGVGKVTVKIQNRTMEYLAVTSDPEPLATGTPVIVVGMVAPDTVEVGPVKE